MALHLPDGEHQVNLTCPYRSCGAAITLTMEGPESTLRFDTCGTCRRTIAIDSDCDTWKMPVFLAFCLLIFCFIPVMVVDKTVWTALNSASEFLQRAFVVSKYQLAFGAFGFGLASFLFLDTTWWAGTTNALVWTLITFPSLRWCLYKARTTGDEDTETPHIYDRHPYKRLKGYFDEDD